VAISGGRQIADENLTAYDAAYVALAERHSVPLVTGDRALANAPGLRCQIHLIAA
jgi:predicted nucleic acid-binding protein